MTTFVKFRFSLTPEGKKALHEMLCAAADSFIDEYRTVDYENCGGVCSALEDAVDEALLYCERHDKDFADSENDSRRLWENIGDSIIDIFRVGPRDGYIWASPGSSVQTMEDMCEAIAAFEQRWFALAMLISLLEADDLLSFND